jgi:hypothetical protein
MTNQRSVDFRIAPELFAELKQALATTGEDRWRNVYGELQGGATRVYFAGELLDDVSEAVLADYRITIMQLIGSRLPVKINGEWTWCVTIKSANGEIVDAVDAIDFAYDQ